MDLVILRYIEGQNTHFKRRWPGYSLPLIRTLEFLSRFEIHIKKYKCFWPANFVQSVKIPQFLDQSLIVRPDYVRISKPTQN